MAVYVLVHGGWAGAHGFRKVRPLLWEAGHHVFTPSLTGIGERAHLVSPQVGLSTHVQDVVNVLLYEDLTDVVLLGFSYGGFVVTGCLEHVAERVRHLVFLDAFVPNDGESVVQLMGYAEQRVTMTVNSDWLVAPAQRQYEDPNDTVWENARRTPHPVGCFTEPVRLPQPLEDYPFTRTYIKATKGDTTDAGGAFVAAAERARASSAWRYREIATDHMVPSNRPRELADLLLELAEDSPPG